MDFKNRIAKFLISIGISANFLTMAGFLLAASSGFFALQGKFILAGVLFLLSGLLDMLDGAVARASGSVKPFGGILDSTLDRYGDALVLGGILFFCIGAAKMLLAVLCFSSILGSFNISYVRARAECEIDSCRAGFWERAERLVFISLGLLFNNLTPVLLILGIGTHWSVFERLCLARKPGTKQPLMRTSLSYYIKIGVLIGLVLFYRVSF